MVCGTRVPSNTVTTIMHVEDDPDLADSVKAAFEGSGFRGSDLVATTVSEARQIADSATRDHRLNS
jgi:hypothetical protein